jgi:phage tail sheath protein FI
MSQFFHGARVTNAPSTPPPITSVSSSVIGLLCTGDNAQAAVAATLNTGLAGTNNALVFTAVNSGSVGNQISVAMMNPAADTQALSVAVNTTAILVSLATDGEGNITSTAAQVLAAINADLAAAALVTVTEGAGSSGAGVVTASTALFLSGGIDCAFPIDTPVLVPGGLEQAAALIGTVGTGYQALTDIANQGEATVIVVRVTDSMVAATLSTNLVGSVDGEGGYHGAQAFMGAEALTGVRPMILIAPGFTGNGFTGAVAVTNALLNVANSLRAHVIVEGPNTTDAAAVAYGQGWGTRRLFLVDPGLQEVAPTGNTINVTNSATVAGLIAWVDNNLGFWWSPSNQTVTGITGTTRPVDYTQANPNCRANYLNSQNVATFIRRNGFRLWGNRTLSADPTFAFLCVSRTDDVIALSIQDIVNDWAVDHPVNGTFFSDVTDEINNYFATLVSQGSIAGGNAYPNPTLNTPSNIASGKVYFNYGWSPSYPAEDIEISDQVVETFLASLTSNS